MASRYDTNKPNKQKQVIDFQKNYHHICSDINNLELEELKIFLESHSKSPNGCIEILKKRAKSIIPRHITAPPKSQLPYLLVLDFECTCESPKPLGWQHEVIEFPILLLNTQTLKVEKEFHSFCRPILNPKLTKFCVDYTGISQDKVDTAPTFVELLPLVDKWVYENVVARKVPFAFATDGPWDFFKFLRPQCEFSHLEYPWYATKWVNVRKHFSRYYGLRGGISYMLECLGQKFIGEPHSGIDDTRNICSIVVQLLEDGASLCINDSLSANKHV
ncbi:3'-5' exoribonuclease 1-like [Oopsacas minuta]|uniref:3'-5' exoribonuclease 1-like n=1 Tax=Oopsacas minuta TaxID=111878 RepID=A0AAV7JMZ1_9METZ|nr:3'-5' exoribonuclease 1-like [Oopsacas minuta]